MRVESRIMRWETATFRSRFWPGAFLGPILRLVPAKSRAAYPEWLLRDWRRLEHWRNSGTARLAPWGFRRVEAALIWADRAWRAGSDPVRINAFLDAELAKFVQYQEELRSTPRPDPHTLAVLIASGVEPEPALVAEVQGLARRLTLASTGAAAGARPRKAECRRGEPCCRQGCLGP